MANLFTNNENSNSDSHNSGEHPDKIRFEKEMADIIPVLVSIIEQAHENMLADISNKHPFYLSHLSKSVRMHEQIKGLISDEFGLDVKKMKYNRFGLFKGNFVMLFKKLDIFGRPSNIKTVNSILLLSSGKLNFPGEPLIVHIGYVVDRTWEQIKKVYAVGIADNEVVWMSNLRANNNGAVLPVITNKPLDAPDDGLAVVPKNNPKRTNTGS
jgi:hypothetical protein